MSYRALFRFVLQTGILFLLAAALASAAAAQDPTDYLFQTGRPTFAPVDTFPGGTINLANGDLHIEIPLGSFSQRGSIPVNMKLVYDSRVWVQASAGASGPVYWTSAANAWGVQSELPSAPFGWQLVGDPKVLQIDNASTSFAPTCDPNATKTNGDYRWIAPDGAVHVFSVWGTPHCIPGGDTALDAFASDGSGLHLFEFGAGHRKIYAKDGTLVYSDPTATCPSSCNPWQIVQSDTNGNTLLWLFPNGLGTFPNVTDTLGRTPITEGSVTFGPQFPLNVLNSQNTMSSFTVKIGNIGLLYTHFNGTTNSGAIDCGAQGSSGCHYSQQVIKSITLPDGATYSFTYDCGSDVNHGGDSTICSNNNGVAGETYGLMTSMTLPSGGTVSFSYTNFVDSAPSASIFTSNVNRWLTGISYGGSQWTYTPATGCGTNCQTVTVARPSGVNEVYTFNTSNRTSTLNTKIQYFNGVVTGTPSLTLQNTWESYITCAVGGYATDPFPHLKNTTFTMPAPAGNLVGETSYVFDSFVGACPGSNVTTGKLLSKSEFGFGIGAPGPLVRKTAFTYLDDGNAAYLTAGTAPALTAVNIMNRVVDQQIQDGAGNVKAETKITYDSPGPASITGVQNHDDTNFSGANTVRGNPTLIQRLVSGSTFISVASLTYDATGQVTQVQDALNNATTFSYADHFYQDSNPPQNPPATVSTANPTNAYPTQITLPIIGSSNLRYYYGSGKQAFSIDQNGADSYSHFLHPFDRLTHSFLPVTNGNRGWTLTAYTTGGTQTDSYSAITDTSASTSCGSCQHSRQTFDSFGRPIQSVLVSDPQGATITTTTYDSAGRTQSVSNPYRSTTDNTYGVTSFSFDSLGRTTITTEADGSSIKYYYGADVSTHGGASAQLCSTSTYGIGLPVLTVDEAGKKRQTWIDGLSRLIEVDEPTSSGALSVATCYTYDVLDNLTGVTQNGGRQRTYVYDGLSLLRSETNPESGTRTYGYDANSNIISVTSPAPNQTGSATVTISYCYDALNRLTSKAYTAQSCPMPSPTATYTYDVSSIDGDRWFQNTVGRLVKAEQIGFGLPVRTYFDYDAVGRISARAECVWVNCLDYGSTYAGHSPPWWIVTNTYDLAGNLTSYTDAFGHTLTQSYDGASRPTQLTSSWSDATHPATLFTVDSSMGYFPNGALRKATLGNRLVQTNVYNSRLQPCLLDVYNSGIPPQNCSDNPPAGNVLHLRMDYNAGTSNNGNVVSWNATGNQSFARTFTYDALNRLFTMADSASGQACKGLNWTYDAWGNRTDQTVANGTCNTFHQSVDPNNRLLGSPYQYDAAGNMIHDAGHAYFYDPEGHLTQIDGTAGNCAAPAVCYLYDTEGHRVYKYMSGGSNTTSYIYNTDDQVVSYTDPSGGWNLTYLHFGGQLIAEYAVTGAYFFHSDHLGSTRLGTDWNGNITANYDYLPFGEQLTGANETPIKFTGDERDIESNLDHTQFRHYSSSLGRWMTPDPAGLAAVDTTNPQSWNRYSYVNNNPLNTIDPSGLCDEFDTSDCGFDTPDAWGWFWYSWQPIDISGYAGFLNSTYSDPLAAGPSLQTGGPIFFGQSYVGASYPNDGSVLSQIMADPGLRSSWTTTFSSASDWVEAGTQYTVAQGLGVFGGAIPTLGKALYYLNLASLTPSSRLQNRGLYGLNKLNNHHELPRQFKRNFEGAGIDINDPQYIQRIPRYLHEDIHSGLYTGGVKYNDRWAQFFAGPEAEAEAPAILRFLESLRASIPR